MSLADHYPAQEPMSPLGAAYQQTILALGEGLRGQSHAYGPGPNQTLEVFPSASASDAVLVFFHGGGWTNGYKEWMYFMAPALQAEGIHFVSASYRLAPAHVFPAGMDDCADALAYVLQGRVGLPIPDGAPARVYVGGHSGGGHYAALLAVTSAWRSARGLAAQPLAGCLPVSGVYLLGEGSGLSQRPRFLGPSVDAAHDAQVERSASPLHLIEPAACPPFLMAHGERDFPHLIAQAAQMRAALLAAGVPTELEILEACDHFETSVACGDATRPWVARAAAWMRGPGRSTFS